MKAHSRFQLIPGEEERIYVSYGGLTLEGVSVRDGKSSLALG